MLINTLSTRWQRIRKVNATDNGFPSRVPTLTKPTGAGNSAAQATESAVISMIADGTSFLGGAIQNKIKAMFYGAGSNNNTFSVRFIGWTLLEDSDHTKDVWFPTDLCEVQVTLTSSIAGPAGGIVTTTDLFADTIAITGATANQGVDIDVRSPANDRAGFLTLVIEGFMLLETIFTTGGVATNCNGLISEL